MTNPDELEDACSRVAEMAGWFSDSDDGETLLARSVALEHASDLRLILAANRKMREALEQSTITLRMLKRNVETEIKHHDGLFRWEGVPEAIQVSIDQSRSALTTQRGD